VAVAADQGDSSIWLTHPIGHHELTSGCLGSRHSHFDCWALRGVWVVTVVADQGDSSGWLTHPIGHQELSHAVWIATARHYRLLKL
jgi:hypothetical protein